MVITFFDRSMDSQGPTTTCRPSASPLVCTKAIFWGWQFSSTKNLVFFIFFLPKKSYE